MTHPAVQRFNESLDQIEPGATLSRIDSDRIWTVTKTKWRDGAAQLEILSGKHRKTIYVPYCFSGHCLHELHMRSVKPPPSQRSLSLPPARR